MEHQQPIRSKQSMALIDPAIAAGLGDPQHLQRERALQQLQAALDAADPAARGALIADVETNLLNLLAGDRWEQRLGGLLGAGALVQRTPACSFDDVLTDECLRLLEDEEPRVRLAVGDCLHRLAVKLGPSVYERCRERLLASIHANYDREGEGDKAPASAVDRDGAGLLSALLSASYQPLRPGVGELRHGTEGWKCLETSVKALQRLVDGTGAAFQPYVSPELQTLLSEAAHHPNRYVRETTHLTLASLFGALPADELANVGAPLAGSLLDGMTDNWSQVGALPCRAD